MRRTATVLAAALLMLSTTLAADAAIKPRPLIIVPFSGSALEAKQQWMGQGIAEALALGLTQHPAFVVIDRARLQPFGGEGWTDAAIARAARALRAEAALFGVVTRKDADFVIHPKLMEMKGGGHDVLVLEPVTVTEEEFLARLGGLPATYAKTMKVALSDAEAARMEKAARPTASLRAFELFSRAQAAVARGGQDSRESAVDLLNRAIEADANFVGAQYALGVVHQALGNRWKAAAQFRASTQLDPTYAEPYKALGDLFLAAPRRLFDQAVEAYAKAIELRPFYADAHVGLGDARAAKGDVDGAIAAYQKALTFNPVNPKVHLSLGKIYYAEKGLYYESVQAYKKAIDLDPQSVDARMGLGEVYEDKGLYKEALEEYKRAFDTDPKNTGALYNLASVYEKVDPHEAIVQWERYISLASSLPSEKDWVDVARQHLRKLKSQVKE